MRRFLGGAGLPDAADVEAPATPGHSQAADTQTVRRIIAELDALPRDRARFLAAFAYILTRAAAADLHISDVESSAVEHLVAEYGALPEPQAVLVAKMAHSQSLLYGATEDYLVTRQFREFSSADERLALLRCCYLVGAADGTISAEESHTLQQIAKELDVERDDVNALRTEFAPKIAAIQALYHLRGETVSTEDGPS